jgi:hypothetical protein
MFRLLQEDAPTSTALKTKELAVDRVAGCMVSEDTLAPLSDGRTVAKHLDRDRNGAISWAEVATATATALQAAFGRFEAGALYVRCRGDGWVKNNQGLVQPDQS